MDPNIVAARPCPSSNSQKYRKRLETDEACDAHQQFTNGNQNSNGDQNSNEGSGTPWEPNAKPPSFPEPVEDEYMREFNRRPLSEDEDMDDMCKRFYGGLFSIPVCSSGHRIQQIISPMTHPHIPRAEIWDLVNCRRGMSNLTPFTPCEKAIV